MYLFTHPPASSSSPNPCQHRSILLPLSFPCPRPLRMSPLSLSKELRTTQAMPKTPLRPSSVVAGETHCEGTNFPKPQFLQSEGWDALGQSRGHFLSVTLARGKGNSTADTALPPGRVPWAAAMRSGASGAVCLCLSFPHCQSGPPQSPSGCCLDNLRC